MCIFLVEMYKNLIINKNQSTYDYVKFYIGYFDNCIPVWGEIFTLENFEWDFIYLFQLNLGLSILSEKKSITLYMTLCMWVFVLEISSFTQVKLWGYVVRSIVALALESLEKSIIFLVTPIFEFSKFDLRFRTIRCLLIWKKRK